MKINDKFTLTLPTPNMDGTCVVTLQKQKIFIRNGIENEKVEVTLIKQIQEGFIGEITKILTPSKDRIQNKCPHTNCGGCNYNHLDYEAQLQLKHKQITQLYVNEKINIHPIVGAQQNRAYRNKCIYTFQKGKKIKFGFYEENTHRVIDIPMCLNHDELSTKILSEIKKLALRYKMEIFDEDKQTGILRHVLIRRTYKQTLVCLVIGYDFKGSCNFVKELVKKVPEITTVVFNFNNKKTSAVLSKQEKVVYGKGFIVDTLCNKTYRISASTFYQIHHQQTEKLYTKVKQLAALTNKETVLDMYCGVGTIGLTLSDQAKQVIGVEINEQSILDAKNNALMNHVSNSKFISKDATIFMKEYASKKEKADVVILDPPRSGSTPQFIDACVSMNPKKIVYVSCNPITQKRDLQLFKKYGYETHDIYPYDLFPFSSHIETVVLLSHKKADGHINIKVDYGDKEGQVALKKAKEKATYKKIQQYVEDKFGFKVHTAYIAEVKRSLGLKMYDAPNAVEKLKNPRKHPTEVQVKAITQALKHFEVIA